MLSSGANVIIWDEMLSSGMKCYHLELMLSSGTKCYHLGWNVIIWNAMLSCGANFIIWDKMLSSGDNVVILSFGANVIIWCYHVMLSIGMITPPLFIFPEPSLTRISGPWGSIVSKRQNRCTYWLIDAKAKCRHLKKLPVKGLCSRCLPFLPRFLFGVV